MSLSIDRTHNHEIDHRYAGRGVRSVIETPSSRVHDLEAENAQLKQNLTDLEALYYEEIAEYKRKVREFAMTSVTWGGKIVWG